MTTMSTIEKLKQLSAARLEQAKKSKFKKDADPRFWKHTYDQKTGIGHSIIRFLGPVKDENALYVNKFTHWIKGPNKQYYIESCPKSISNKHKCPACEMAGSLWDNNSKENTLARVYMRRKKFIMNILVVHDQANPENNGKVFLYESPKVILDKITNTMVPENDFDQAIDVFDMWTGANFRLKTKMAGGFLNYSDSIFDAPKSIFEEGSPDSKYEELWNNLHPLSEFVKEESFKPYSELKFAFENAFGNDSGLSKEISTTPAPTIEDKFETPKENTSNNTSTFDSAVESSESFFDNLND